MCVALRRRARKGVEDPKVLQRRRTCVGAALGLERRLHLEAVQPLLHGVRRLWQRAFRLHVRWCGGTWNCVAALTLLSSLPLELGLQSVLLLLRMLMLMMMLMMPMPVVVRQGRRGRVAAAARALLL